MQVTRVVIHSNHWLLHDPKYMILRLTTRFGITPEILAKRMTRYFT